MRKPNFSKLSSAVLEAYKADIEKELADREKSFAKKEKVLAKMRNLAKAEGLDLEMLLNDSAPATRKASTARKTTTKVAPKYQNPKNSAEKWTGRGRQPKWVSAYLAKNGTKLEQLLIKK